MRKRLSPKSFTKYSTITAVTWLGLDFFADKTKKLLVWQPCLDYHTAYLNIFMPNGIIQKWIENTWNIIRIENSIIFTQGGPQLFVAQKPQTNFAGNMDDFHQVVQNSLQGDVFFPFII